jgi:hypothetical protein
MKLSLLANTKAMSPYKTAIEEIEKQLKELLYESSNLIVGSMTFDIAIKSFLTDTAFPLIAKAVKVEEAEKTIDELQKMITNPRLVCPLHCEKHIPCFACQKLVHDSALQEIITQKQSQLQELTK